MGDDKRDIPRLVEQLRTGSKYEMLVALLKLGELGSDAKSSVPAIMDFLALSENRPAYTVAITALIAMGPVGINALIACQHHPDEDVRVVAAAGVYEFDEDQAAYEILAHACLERGRCSLRAACALAKHSTAYDLYVGILKQHLESEESNDRRLAILALAASRYRGQDLLPLLIGALDDAEWAIQHASVTILASMGSLATEALPELRQLADSDPSPATSAAQMLIEELESRFGV